MNLCLWIFFNFSLSLYGVDDYFYVEDEKSIFKGLKIQHQKKAKQCHVLPCQCLQLSLSTHASQMTKVILMLVSKPKI
jgi:hypothetical protein